MIQLLLKIVSLEKYNPIHQFAKMQPSERDT